jgi:hypothetical protein
VAPKAAVAPAPAKKATAKKAVKAKARKVAPVAEPVYIPTPPSPPTVYNDEPVNREPEKVEITQRHNGPTTVLIKDGRVTVNDEEVARLTDGQHDCIRIRINQEERAAYTAMESEEIKTTCKPKCTYKHVRCYDRCGISTWKCRSKSCPDSDNDYRRKLHKDNRWRP